MNPLNFIYSIGAIQAILLFSGLILIIVEMFNPGFGAAGITGIIFLIVGVLLTAKTLFDVMIMLLIILVILGVALAFVIRSATKGRLNKRLVLPDSLKKEQGYSSSQNLEHLIGKEGVAITVLRPSGTANFDGVILDVVTEGKYIPKDSKVKVIDVSGRRIVVRNIG
jgi:membrane-bound ClpP family serine protease